MLSVMPITLEARLEACRRGVTRCLPGDSREHGNRSDRSGLDEPDGEPMTITENQNEAGENQSDVPGVMPSRAAIVPVMPPPP